MLGKAIAAFLSRIRLASVIFSTNSGTPGADTPGGGRGDTLVIELSKLGYGKAADYLEWARQEMFGYVRRWLK